jgi:Fe-S-cluster-containing hydrogenase component 2
MNAAHPAISRRAFLSSLLPGRIAGASVSDVPAPMARDADLLAIIAGRHCLAYTGSFCSVCHERCPLPGAIVVERGLPRIDPSLCNGCRVCHDVCPAPTNAVRLIPRPTAGPLASNRESKIENRKSSRAS